MIAPDDVADIIASLTHAQREALSLRLYDRLPFSTIATRMGITVNAAQKLVERGLANLGACGVAFDPETLQPTPIGLPNPLDISPMSFSKLVG